MLALAAVLAAHASAEVDDGALRQTKGSFVDNFRQLDGTLPDPNVYRSATGAPGPQYWQQRADYDIDVTLDEAARRITGTETIRYTNNSPETLRYLWIQLDQNRFMEDSNDRLTRTIGDDARISYNRMRAEQYMADFDGGHRITAVTSDGSALDYLVTGTQMRIDLPGPVNPGNTVEFTIDWNYDIGETRSIGGRAGYEHFPEDGNDIFLLAQWYPRLVAFSDYEGWHNKEFLGNGEFTLEFGDFEVDITVPADHVVSSTGVLTEPERRHDARAAPAHGRSGRRRSPCVHHHAGRSAGERGRGHGRAAHLALRSRERARLRLGDLAQVHLGRPGPRPAEPRRRAGQGHGHVLLSEGRRAAVVALLHAGRDPHHGGLLALLLPLPLSDGAVRQRARRRHGVPDDHLQRPAHGPARGR